MPLAAMDDIIGPARAAGRGVGAFNVIGIEHAEAIVAGAEAAAVAGGAADQRELRRLPPRARPDRRGVPGPRARRRGAGRRAPRPRLRRGARRGRGRARARLGHVRRVPAALRRQRPRHGRRRARRATGAASGSRRNSARSAARTACTRRSPAPIPARRPASSRRPGWTRSRSRSAARTPWRPATRCSTSASSRACAPRSAFRSCCTARPACPTEVLAAAVRAGMTKVNIATQLNKVFTAAVRLVLVGRSRDVRSEEVRGRRDATRSRRR